MYRDSTQAGVTSRTRPAFRMLIAAALASSLAIGGAGPAFAKDKQEAPAPGNSKPFIQAYAPMQTIINNPSGDFAAAKAMVPTVLASVQNNADKNTFGLALVTLGTKLNDPALQKEGLQLALDSGMATPAQAGVFQFFLGKFDYDAKNYAEARSHFQAALQAGYNQNDPRPAIAETYFGAGQSAEGLSYLSGVIKQEQAAGRAVPSEWLLRGLLIAYQSKLVPQANEYAEMLAASAPTPKNWQAALQVVNAVDQLDSESKLDVYRLMRLTGSLQAKQDYLGYVDAADPQRLSNEVLPVLEEGVKAGVLTTGDSFYTQAKSIAESRAAAHKSVLASVAADAQKAPDGKIAMGAGDQYFSIADYANAARMYQLALDKGAPDRQLALVRLGIAQAEQGQLDAAKSALQQVTGARAPVAKMWLAYIATKSGAPSAAPANGA
ncbi:MAG TPA: hypothetical protein VIC34_15620 [Croceibacterium sp.]|jgi:hypothetical protein